MFQAQSVSKRRRPETASLLKRGTSMYAVICTGGKPVSYTHLRAHETGRKLVCRLLLEKKKKKKEKEKEVHEGK